MDRRKNNINYKIIMSKNKEELKEKIMYK